MLKVITVDFNVNLTPLELSCLAELSDAWNDFLLLEELHSDDLQEFRMAIHAAQNIILARPLLRALAKG
jgi:hypothetical protein